MISKGSPTRGTNARNRSPQNISRDSICPGVMVGGCQKLKHFLKGAVHRLLLTGTHPGPRQTNESSRTAIVIEEETELYSFGMIGGRAVSNTPVLSPRPTWHQPGELYQLYPDNSLRLHPNQIEHSQKLCWWQPAWVNCAVFLKKLSRNPREAQEDGMGVGKTQRKTELHGFVRQDRQQTKAGRRRETCLTH